jgi:hypothetical protein
LFWRARAPFEGEYFFLDFIHWITPKLPPFPETEHPMNLHPSSNLLSLTVYEVKKDIGIHTPANLTKGKRFESGGFNRRIFALPYAIFPGDAGFYSVLHGKNSHYQAFLA